MSTATSTKKSSASKKSSTPKPVPSAIEPEAEESQEVVVATPSQAVAQRIASLLAEHPEYEHRFAHVLARVEAEVNGTQPPADAAPLGTAATLISWR